MKYAFNYLGTSGMSGSALRFAPNLYRQKVHFDAEIRNAVRFREAMSALHEVVIGDLRAPKKDRSAHEAWKQQQSAEDLAAAAQVRDQVRERELARHASPPPPELESQYRKQHGIYWGARRRWADELARTNPRLFRALVPCDPVVTVSPDVVLFECFSKDESSYGCLTVEREAFRGDAGSTLGTTNVDYSLGLYEHFQTMRSYRPTRLLVDPSGFEVKVEGREDYREEKIDLPSSWLRGFGQLQAAMSLPCRRVELSIESVYAILAHLRKHKEKAGPRSLRFELAPGKAPVIHLDPWNLSVEATGAASIYKGERAEEVKVWGRRRLMTLARLLPIAERVEVRLLGSGLPSLWIVYLGDMRFVLALSGWTANDWTAGSNLDLLAGNLRPEPRLVDRLALHLEQVQTAKYSLLEKVADARPEVLLGSLYQLARQGQIVYDFAQEVYRYRQVMPVPLTDAVLGGESEELVEGRKLYSEGLVKVEREETVAAAPGSSSTATRRLLIARVGKTACEGILDGDLKFSRAKCTCSFFHKTGLRAGPCRHLLALRLWAGAPAALRSFLFH